MIICTKKDVSEIFLQCFNPNLILPALATQYDNGITKKNTQGSPPLD